MISGKTGRLILNFAGELSWQLQGILKTSGIELVSPEDCEQLDGFSAIFTRNHIGSYESFSKTYNTISRNIPIISLSKIENKADFLRFNGRAYINEDFLKINVAQRIIQRLFLDESSLNFEDAYESLFETFKTIKLTGHMATGFYADMVSIDAFEKGFNIIGIRNFFTGIVSYLSYLQKAHIASFPFEIEYGENEEAFVLQIHASVRNFTMEYVLESFEDDSGFNPFKYLLKMCSNLGDIFDVYFLKKSLKIVFTGVWMKEDLLDDEKYFSSMQINNIDSFKQIEKKTEASFSKPQIAIEINRNIIVKELENKSLPGDFIDFLASGSQWLTRYPVLLRTIVEYVKRNISTDKSAKKILSMTISDIDKYIADYPNKKIIGKLGKDDKELILKSVCNQGIVDGINDAIKDGFVDVDENFRDRYFDSIIDSISTLGLGGTNNDLVNIEGDVPDDISGHIDSIRVSGNDVGEVEEELHQIVLSKLDVDDEKAKILVDGVLDQATNLLSGNKVCSELGDILRDNNAEINEYKLRSEIYKRDERIKQMMNLIRNMKSEMTIQKKTSDFSEKISSPDDLSELIRVLDGSGLKSADENPEQLLRGLATSDMDRYNQIMKNKDDKITQLEKRISLLANRSFLNSNETKYGKEIVKLRKENESLLGLVNVSNKRISAMNENLAKDERKGKSIEFDKLRENYKRILGRATEYKEKNEQLEGTIGQLQIRAEKMKVKIQENKWESGGAGVPSTSSVFDDKHAGILSMELKSSEERYKAAGAKIRDLEKKVRYLSKANPDAVKDGKKDVSTKGLEHKIKQLELLNVKMDEGSKKSLVDLNDKKKEIQQLKSETIQLKHQMSAMERKLGYK